MIAHCVVGIHKGYIVSCVTLAIGTTVDGFPPEGIDRTTTSLKVIGGIDMSRESLAGLPFL